MAVQLATVTPSRFDVDPLSTTLPLKDTVAEFGPKDALRFPAIEFVPWELVGTDIDVDEGVRVPDHTVTASISKVTVAEVADELQLATAMVLEVSWVVDPVPASSMNTAPEP